MGRKAGTDIGVNSCLVALIASETVSIALSWLLLQFWNDIVAKILSFISLPNLKPHGQSKCLVKKCLTLIRLPDGLFQPSLYIFPSPM